MLTAMLTKLPLYTYATKTPDNPTCTSNAIFFSVQPTPPLIIPWAILLWILRLYALNFILNCLPPRCPAQFLPCLLSVHLTFGSFCPLAPLELQSPHRLF